MASTGSGPDAFSMGATTTSNERGNGDLPFAKELFEAADRLRGSVESAEYKHLVLGLLFLRYISDAFERRRAWLDAATHDPEKGDYFTAVALRRRRRARLQAAHRGRALLPRPEGYAPAPSLFHRKDERIRAHVLICFLALVLIRVAETRTAETWRTLRTCDRRPIARPRPSRAAPQGFGSTRGTAAR